MQRFRQIFFTFLLCVISFASYAQTAVPDQRSHHGSLPVVNGNTTWPTGNINLKTGQLQINGSQFAFSNLAGSLACGQTPALTGDTTTSAGSCATVTGKVNGGSIPTSATALASNGSNQIITATFQGNGSKVQLSTGTTTTNDCVKFDVNGNTVDAGAACGSGGGSVTWPASTDIVISNTTNTPNGLAPVNGDCVIGSGGNWVAGSCTGTADNYGSAIKTMVSLNMGGL